MSSLGLIQKITRLAIQNFSRDPSKANVAGSEFEQIKKLVSNISVSDLNIDPSLLEDRGLYNPSREIAPVTYMQIYEDSDVTICVFILKNGVKLPLHDHPEMNGLLKVIHGCVRIQSYSRKYEVNMENEKILTRKKSYSSIYPAIKHPCITMSPHDPVCLLRPDSHNLHEIATEGGLAAFLDILSPPYGLDKRIGSERECHYYEEIDSKLGENLPNDCVLLMNIPTPLEFWCDQAEYKGPPVSALGFISNGQNPL